LTGRSSASFRRQAGEPLRPAYRICRRASASFRPLRRTHPAHRPRPHVESPDVAAHRSGASPHAELRPWFARQADCDHGHVTEFQSGEVRLADLPAVTLFCGLPGSGKTTLAKCLEADGRGIRLCTDDWQGELGVDHTDADFHNRLQPLLYRHALTLLRHGVSVILECPGRLADGQLWFTGSTGSCPSFAAAVPRCLPPRIRTSSWAGHRLHHPHRG